MSENKRRTITFTQEVDNKLAYLQGYDITKGRQTIAQVIERLINEEYDRVKSK